MKIRFLVLGLCLVTVAAFGQTNPKKKELQPFAGSWQCTGTTFASPWAPEHSTKASVTGAWILGGQWMEVHYWEAKTAKNAHPVDVRIFYGYDEQLKALVGGSVDNTGAYSTQQSTGWQGDKLVFSGPMHGGGATMTTRDTYTKVGDNEVRHMGELEEKGVWKKLDQEVCKKK
ncbi:MAG: hypothetical protein QOK37_3192 [Thermoanaerobaculia bacterium]|jgi:hypothetical protein|nr:hypothetical protein [Thermoanaerobaculia bacterium]